MKINLKQIIKEEIKEVLNNSSQEKNLWGIFHSDDMEYALYGKPIYFLWVPKNITDKQTIIDMYNKLENKDVTYNSYTYPKKINKKDQQKYLKEFANELKNIAERKIQLSKMIKTLQK